MDSSAVWIIVAIVAVLIVVGVAFAARNRRHTKLHSKAERIRAEVDEESGAVDRRAALAEETAARARAARAEAEAKEAEATRLEERAGTHRDAAVAARDDLEARLDHADEIDPKVRTSAREASQAPMRPAERPDTLERPP